MRITDGKEDGNATDKNKKKQLENVKNLVQNDKKLSMVEQGEIEENKWVKREVVLNVTNNEKTKAIKVNMLNPTPTRSTNPKGNEILFAAKEKLPNPVDTGIEEGNKKESPLDWVHRYFGTSKEYMKQINVTINHSFYEIPSQTYENSGKNGENY